MSVLMRCGVVWPSGIVLRDQGSEQAAGHGKADPYARIRPPPDQTCQPNSHGVLRAPRLGSAPSGQRTRCRSTPWWLRVRHRAEDPGHQALAWCLFDELCVRFGLIDDYTHLTAG